MTKYKWSAIIISSSKIETESELLTMPVYEIEVEKDLMIDDREENLEDLGFYIFLSIPEFEGEDEGMRFGSDIDPFLDGIKYGETAFENGAWQDPDDKERECGYYFKNESDADRFAKIIEEHLIKSFDKIPELVL